MIVLFIYCLHVGQIWLWNKLLPLLLLLQLLDCSSLLDHLVHHLVSYFLCLFSSLDADPNAGPPLTKKKSCTF